MKFEFIALKHFFFGRKLIKAKTDVSDIVCTDSQLRGLCLQRKVFVRKKEDNKIKMSSFSEYMINKKNAEQKPTKKDVKEESSVQEKPTKPKPKKKAVKKKAVKKEVK